MPAISDSGGENSRGSKSPTVRLQTDSPLASSARTSAAMRSTSEPISPRASGASAADSRAVRSRSVGVGRFMSSPWKSGHRGRPTRRARKVPAAAGSVHGPTRESSTPCHRWCSTTLMAGSERVSEIGLAAGIPPGNTEPHGSLFGSTRCGVRGALGPQSQGDSGAPRAQGRDDQRTRRGVRDDAHRDQEARADPRGGRIGDHEEGRACAELHPRKATSRPRGRMDVHAPPAARSTARPTRRVPRAHERKRITSATTQSQHVMTTPGDRTILVERIFNATRERVWKAYTDPKLLAQWWGRGNQVDIERYEFEKGGHYRFVEHSDHGSHGFEGRYREITPMERLSMTFE